MTHKTTRPKKSAPEMTPQEVGKTILSVFFYTIGGFIFYVSLFIGLILIVSSFFNLGTSTFVVLLGVGAGIVGLMLLINLVITGLGTGKWRLTWPDLTFMGPY